MTAGTAAPVAARAAPARASGSGPSRRTREALAVYGFLSPWIAGMLLLIIGPMLYSLYLSFTRYNLMTPAQWVTSRSSRRTRALYPPGYQASFEGAFRLAYESVVFGGTSTRDAATAFFTEVNAALAAS